MALRVTLNKGKWQAGFFHAIHVVHEGMVEVWWRQEQGRRAERENEMEKGWEEKENWHAGQENWKGVGVWERPPLPFLFLQGSWY